MMLDAAHLAWMEERFTDFKRPLPAANRQQAMIPDGARKLRMVTAPRRASGSRTTAAAGWRCCPVCRARCAACSPTHCSRSSANVSAGARVVRSRTLRTTGVGESFIADRVDDDSGRRRRCRLAYLPNAEGTDLRLTVRGAAPDEADRRARRVGRRLRSVVANAVYGEDGADLAAVVLELCRERGLSIAVAESCTGGLLGARLTAIPGSSDVVLGGVIAYANDVKRACSAFRRTIARERRGERAGGVRDGDRRARGDGSEDRHGDHRRRRPRRRNGGEAGRNGVDRD